MTDSPPPSNVAVLNRRSETLLAEQRADPDLDVIAALEKALDQARSGELRGVAILKAMCWGPNDYGFERVTRHRLFWQLKELMAGAHVVLHEWAADMSEQLKENGDVKR